MGAQLTYPGVADLLGQNRQGAAGVGPLQRRQERVERARLRG